MIRWCLNLKLLSSAAYHAMRSAGFIKLPSERTLRDYTHYFRSKTGFQEEVNDQLRKEAKVSDLPEPKKYCGLILDEMKVKENLVYDKYTGGVVGFTNLGSINDELLNLERECQDDQTPSPVATHILVLMVRGIFFKLEFPFAHFATRGVTADLLFPIVWEAIQEIEAIGLKVIFVTGDGASSNRKFFRMHKGADESAPIYKTMNRYSGLPKRPLFFFSDPPHLIKTARNCWSHSDWNGTRCMTVSFISHLSVHVEVHIIITTSFFLNYKQRNGKFILWKHLRQLHSKLSAMATQSSGLTLLPKLKQEHVHLTSYSRMRVDLAAQVKKKNMGKCRPHQVLLHVSAMYMYVESRLILSCFDYSE